MLNFRHVVLTLVMAAFAVEGVNCYHRRMNCKEDCPAGTWWHYSTDFGCCRSFWDCFGKRKQCLTCPGYYIENWDHRGIHVRDPNGRRLGLGETAEDIASELDDKDTHTPEGDEHFSSLMDEHFEFGDDEESIATLDDLVAEGELTMFDTESIIGQKVLHLIQMEMAGNSLAPPQAASSSSSEEF